jgi:hypothetical protein
MTAMSKQSLIFESVTVIQIGVHPVRKEPDQHVICVASRVSRTTTVHEVPTKSNLSPSSQDEVFAPVIVRLDHHPGLPHSPSNIPP